MRHLCAHFALVCFITILLQIFDTLKYIEISVKFNQQISGGKMGKVFQSKSCTLRLVLLTEFLYDDVFC